MPSNKMSDVPANSRDQNNLFKQQAKGKSKTEGTTKTPISFGAPRVEPWRKSSSEELQRFTTTSPPRISNYGNKATKVGPRRNRSFEELEGFGTISPPRPGSPLYGNSILKELQRFTTTSPPRPGSTLYKNNTSGSPSRSTTGPKLESSYNFKAPNNMTGISYKLNSLQDVEIFEQYGIDLKSLSLKAAEELSKRPKNGEVYNKVTAKVESIKKRLEDLSTSFHMLSIDEAMEIADAAYILKLLKIPNHEIEMAGQMAHNGALLMLQADMLSKKGKELIEQSKRKLKSSHIYN